MKIKFWKKEEYVKCNDCKHLILEKDASSVEFTEIGIGTLEAKVFYCPEHRKPYEKKKELLFHPYDQIRYYKELRVDENGVPIGYKKINEKKDKT